MEQIETMYAYVMRKLMGNKGRWRAVSKDLDISYMTLYSIATGTSENPSIHTIQKLHDYFQDHAK